NAPWSLPPNIDSGGRRPSSTRAWSISPRCSNPKIPVSNSGTELSSAALTSAKGFVDSILICSSWTVRWVITGSAIATTPIVWGWNWTRKPTLDCARLLALFATCAPDRGPDLLRRQRHVEMCDAKGRQRIEYGVHDRRRRANRAAFADPFHAE